MSRSDEIFFTEFNAIIQLIEENRRFSGIAWADIVTSVIWLPCATPNTQCS